MALKRLQQEYKQYKTDTPSFYSIELNDKNPYLWNILIFGPNDTIFEGAIFKCQIIFSNEYPNKAPKFKFISEFKHPNIYIDGSICISILHDDIIQSYDDEDISERWTPIQSVNTIVLSIISLLVSPNLNSPANVDIALLWRDNFNDYKQLIYKMIAMNH
jgi:ubiquitin-conjugating enzyme E2 G1